MPRASHLLHSFNAGEISSRLLGRTDQPFYRAAAILMENMAALPHGPADRRPGTRFVAAAKVEASAVDLLPFVFSDEGQSYAIEAGAGYFRFYRNKAQIGVLDTDAAVTNGDFTAGIAGWTNFSGVLELPFDAETAAFTLGELVTGGTSGHTGTVLSVNKGVAGTGTAGVLCLSGATGTFTDNEALTGSVSGAATADKRGTIIGAPGSITHDAVNGRLNLNGTTTARGWAAQSIATTDAGQVHILAFDVFGLAGDEITLRIGTTVTGNNIVDDRICRTGRHAIAFTPPVSPFYIQFRALGRVMQIDNVAFLDDAPAELGHDYAAADLARLRSDQSFDTLYLACGGGAGGLGYRPRQLTRNADAGWSLEEIKFTDGPYLAENPDDAKTLTLSGGAPWTAGSTLTLTAIDHAPFTAAHVGTIWQLRDPAGTDTAWVTLRSVSDVHTATVTAEVDVPAGLQAIATAAWREGLWSDVRGWPSCVAFHEERLAWGGSPAQPWRVDLSASGLFTTMTPGVDTGDATALVIAAGGRANGVRWLKSTEHGLIAGTAGGVYRLDSNDGQAALAPTDAVAKPIPGSQAADVDAVLAHAMPVFIGRHNRRIRRLQREAATERGLASRDVSLRADHIPLPGAVELAWTETPWPFLWVRRSDGVLLAFTLLLEEEVEAWHRAPLGPSAAGAAAAEALCVIPGANQDELWVVVNRTIDGATHRYIEVMEDWRTDETAPADHFYVDCGITYDGAATDTITGLDHLEGETVQIWADGAPAASKIVQGGQVTLDAAASKVHLGLGYVSKLKPVKPEAGVPAGATAIGQYQRIAGLAALLHRSISFKVGRDEAHLDVVPMNAGMVIGQAPPLQTGTESLPVPGDWARDGELLIVQDLPGPLTITALVPEVATNV